MILQDRLPYTPWGDARMARLPGIQPLALSEWLVVDEAYAGQMRERDRLIAEQAADVHALQPEAAGAARELLEVVLDDLAGRGGFTVGQGAVTRPDGVEVPLDRDAPLLTLGRLVQEDFCLLHPGAGGEHVLTGAILCFPASWMLAEKIGRPLMRIHRPVPPYGEDLGRRVQRLFDGLRPGRGLWRANVHFYDDPTLFHPRPEAAPRAKVEGPAPYLRSERQVLVRLPVSGAVVFSIHTYVIHRDRLSDAQQAALAAHPIAWDPARPG